MRYRGVFTVWTVLALLALFIHKADLVVSPVPSIVLAVDPFPLAFASANFPHGLSHLRDTRCRLIGYHEIHHGLKTDAMHARLVAMQLNATCICMYVAPSFRKLSLYICLY